MELSFECSGREAVNQIELRLQDFPHLRRPAVEAFRAVYEPNRGSDHAFRISVSEDLAAESLVVEVRAVVPVALVVAANREVVAGVPAEVA
jgi:hypothetical protein